MKKSLVLATAMALGITASAYAANPFSDVPAGHWAYDSISKLAAAGVIEGYGDDTFRGDRLMTRYEMAQIVAKAMAKGANVEKLMAEFADELEALGVRVAALEKKSDNVKVTGEIRYKYAHRNYRFKHGRAKDIEHGLRSRLYFTGKVNDNWSYVGRLQNEQDFRTNHSDEGTSFNVAKLQGRLGGAKVVAGHDDDVFADGNIYDGEYDALKVTYGEKWYISGAYGKLTDLNSPKKIGTSLTNKDAAGNPLAIWEDEEDVSNKFWNIEVGTDMDTFAKGKLGYLKANARDKELMKDLFGGDNVGIWYLGAEFGLAKDLKLNAMYLRSNRDKIADENVTKNGYVFGLAYKGAEAAEPGSWGLGLNYYHQGRGTYLAHTIDGETEFASGFKGWSFGGDVAIAKNMVLKATYYDTKPLKSSLDDVKKARVLWTELNFTF